MNLKIAEINIVTILIILFVGAIGILSIYTPNENITIACVSGLVGYMGRYIQTQTQKTTNTQ